MDTKQIGLKPDDIPFATAGLDQPTFYVDHIRGAMLSQGVVKLNLVENRMDAKLDEVRAVHVATLVLPLIQLAPWGKFLTELAADVESQARADAEPDAKPA